MDKRKVFDIFKFCELTKKDDFPLTKTNNVDTQEQNDKLVDYPDSCSTQNRNHTGSGETH